MMQVVVLRETREKESDIAYAILETSATNVLLPLIFNYTIGIENC